MLIQPVRSKVFKREHVDIMQLSVLSPKSVFGKKTISHARIPPYKAGGELKLQGL